MDPSTPGACIDKWRTQICGAWLISIDGCPITSLEDDQTAVSLTSTNNPRSCKLRLLHLEVNPDISNRGVPIMSKADFTQYTHDQLNNRLELLHQPH
jgi:hypothetical protein